MTRGAFYSSQRVNAYIISPVICVRSYGQSRVLVFLNFSMRMHQQWSKQHTTVPSLVPTPATLMLFRYPAHITSTIKYTSI
jgi:hypothetical protein